MSRQCIAKTLYEQYLHVQRKQPVFVVNTLFADSEVYVSPNSYKRVVGKILKLTSAAILHFSVFLCGVLPGSSKGLQPK